MKKNYLKTMALALGLLGWSATTNAQNLLSEDFSTGVGTTPPTGWVQNDISGSAELWYFNNPGGQTLNAPITNPAAIFDSDNNGSGGTVSEETALESPAFDASTAPYIFLNFDHYFNTGAGGEYHVEVFNGIAWTEVIGGTLGTSNPQHENIDITSATGGSTVAQIRFRWVGDWSWYWIVDNISVDVISCPAPLALSASNLTGFTADLSWTEFGAATQWQIEYGTTGFTQGTGTFSLESNDTANVSLLTPVTNYDFYVRAICGAGDTSTWVGPFSFSTTATCPAPTALASSNTTATTSNVSWTESGAATQWQIEYGTTGFTQGTGTFSLESNDTANVSLLTPVTNYDFYVRAICGAGDTSTWVGPFGFTTTCIPVVAPWTETFENGGTIPTCWNQGTSNTEPWKFANTGSGNHIGNNGVISGTTVSSGYFAWVDDSSPNGMGTTLESPLIDISALTTPQLSFYLISNNEGNSNVDFSVDVFDGTTWNVGFFTHNTNTVAGGWEKIIVNLSSLTFTGDMQLRFIVDETNGSDFYDDVAIDDVDIHEQPSCPDVTLLTAGTIYADSAALSWTAGGTETAWNIEWGTLGFTPGTNTELGATNSTTTSDTITGLTPSTSYDIYVQANCGTDSSLWVGPLTIATVCLPDVIPYLEDFNSGAFPFCWTTTDPLDVYVTPTCGVRTNVLRFDNSNEAITNSIDASSILYSVKVSYYIAESVCGNAADAGETFNVDYWNGTQWINAKTYDASRPDAYTYEYFIVPASSLTNEFKVKFDQITGTTDTWLIDSVVVEQGPSCLPVDNITLDNLYADSAQISWTNTGTETAWNIQWGTPGFAPGTGAELGAASYPTTSYMITGLTPNTSYEIYVQANCGTDSSTWVGPLTVFTGYCSFVGTGSTRYINNFSTTGGILNITNNGSGYSPNGYQNATSMKVMQYDGGAPIGFTATFGTGTYGFNIWVDWNSDLFFDDITEKMYASGGYVSTATGSFSIPVGTPVGDYRMRIVGTYIPSNPPACGNTIYGEAEDYTFSVITIPSCMPVTGLTIDNVATDSLMISWAAGGVETNWVIEWGLPGFTPGTGTGTGSTTSNNLTDTISGLNSSTTYDVYVRADCGSGDSSYWALVQGTTLCAPIATLPWSENFDAMTAVGFSMFPNCWVNDYSDWYSDNGANGVSYTAPNNVSIDYGSDDYLWTPEFTLTAGTTYEFAFRWIGDGITGWDGSVYTSESQSSLDGVQLGTNFVTNSEVTSSTDYQKEVYCFTPTVSGDYSFGIHVSANFSPNTLSFDNFSVRIPNPNAGVDGATTVCQVGGLVDLNSIITINDTTGIWAFSPNPSAIQSDTLFNPAFIPSGTTTVYYVVGGCIPDSAMATINIYPKSNAGTDGTISRCNYGPVNLFDGLTGSVDLGGIWHNPAGQAITGSIVNFNGEIAANYNYIYIVGNGVCPVDTSVIEIQLNDCAGVDEYELKGFVLYPNPSNGVINIQYEGKGENVKLDVVDTKGAIVWTKQVQFNDGTTQTIDLSAVETGTYYINMTSKNGGSVMKVIKN